MSDPQRVRQPSAEELTGAERDARIEQLLLAGLDRYFAADYDQAINLWTRVLFLDRAHDRARAYIERARSAQAERQRESEVLLHEGLEAFDQGDVQRARDLVSTALDRGAPDDAALGVLSRLNRLDRRSEARPRGSSVPVELEIEERAGPARRMPDARHRPARGWWPFVVAVVVLLSVGAGWVVSEQPPSPWSTWLAAPAARAPVTVPVTARPLDVPVSSEAYLARARMLTQAGRPRDALRELDRIGVADVLRPQADRLRGELQRTLLDLARLPIDSAVTGAPPVE
ncbi:MAG: hypothetical protein Q8L86_05990 [Vicinamibacterales bacterium]|nr:hypothetical protein [Vicinamibacterales bacterium]